MSERKLFTSESVSEGHPDKIADQISDAILDAILAKDPEAHVAAETAVYTGSVHVFGEISTNAYVDINRVVRDTIAEIGYTNAEYGFSAETVGVDVYKRQVLLFVIGIFIGSIGSGISMRRFLKI